MIDGSHELAVVHHHPGRLRLRSRALEGSAGAKRAADASVALRGIVGVRDVRASAETGSMLVTYAPEVVAADAIAEAVSRNTGIAIGTDEPKPGDEDRLAYIAIDVVREVNTFVQDLTHHRADLRVLVPATLAALSALSLAERGARLPSWDNLLYWSYSIFLSVNGREIHGTTPRRERT
jgi:hypothetical protein